MPNLWLHLTSLESRWVDSKHKQTYKQAFPNLKGLDQSITNKYSETPLIRTLMGLENSGLNRGVSLFILTEI